MQTAGAFVQSLTGVLVGGRRRVVFVTPRRRAVLRRRRLARDEAAARLATAAAPPASARRTASVASLAVLVAEVVGSLLMWAPIPIAWMWVGARVYDATGSLMADGTVVLVGFFVTTVLVMRALTALDQLWVRLRLRAGHEQKGGVLTRVVVASATLGLLAFLVWYYVIEDAYILPFMPST